MTTWWVFLTPANANGIPMHIANDTGGPAVADVPVPGAGVYRKEGLGPVVETLFWEGCVLLAIAAVGAAREVRVRTVEQFRDAMQAGLFDEREA